MSLPEPTQCACGQGEIAPYVSGGIWIWQHRTPEEGRGCFNTKPKEKEKEK